jgi:hypothetical protein
VPVPGWVLEGTRFYAVAPLCLSLRTITRSFGLKSALLWTAKRPQIDNCGFAARLELIGGTLPHYRMAAAIGRGGMPLQGPVSRYFSKTETVWLWDTPHQKSSLAAMAAP